MEYTKLVSAIVVDGKTLIKKDGRSELPFGCEYSIYMKNLENRKVLISVSIDGNDILNGKQIILNSGEEITLERFLENLDEGRKLRFIQKTKEIEAFRGNNAEDGLVVINYTYEREKTNTYSVKGIQRGGFLDGFGDLYGSGPVYAATNSVNSVEASLSANTAPIQDQASLSCEKGITVEGSKSNQAFSRGWIGELEYTTHVDTIELFGYKSKAGIEPEVSTIFVKEKYCPSCGSRYSAIGDVEYCSKDGTFLKETVNGVEVKKKVC